MAGRCGRLTLVRADLVAGGETIVMLDLTTERQRAAGRGPAR